MNPLMILQGLQLVRGALEMLPTLRREYDTIKSAGTYDTSTLADLKAQIEAVDALRMQSWAEADAALDAAAGRSGT